MFIVLTWYLALQLFALGAWPIAFAVCHRLPDRGWGLSKGLGLLIVAFVTMVLAHLAVKWPALGFSFATVSAAWFAMMIISLACLARQAGDMWRFLRRRLRYIAVLELVMAAAFILMVALRATVPHISYHIPNPMPGSLIDHAAEKYMDFAVLNGLLTSSSFPPHDAWLSGMTLNYYYFGHMLWAVLIKFCSIRPEIGFNLALASVFSLSSALSFALGYNLTGRLRWGWMGLFLIVLSSNLDGFWQFAMAVKTALIDANSDGIWYFSSRPWWRNYDFWRSSRAIANTINEFPAFSFILGDLHAHLSALMLNLCGWNLAVQMFRSVRQYRSLWRYEVNAFDELFLAALICGGLSATNSWDVPLFAGVIALAMWCGATGRRDPYAYALAGERPLIRTGRAIEALLVSGIVVAIGVAILFYPFLWNFHVPDPAPVARHTVVDGVATVVMEPGQMVRIVSPLNRSNPFEFFTHWALLAIIPLLFVLSLLRRKKVRPGDEIDRQAHPNRARAIALILVAGAAAVVIMPLWQGWVAVTMAALAIIFGALLVTRHLPPTTRWVAGLVTMFCVTVWFCELFYVDDIYEGATERINTVFKVYYGLWPLMAVATILAMRMVIRTAAPGRRRLIACAMVAPVVIAGSPYMVLGTINRITSTTRLGHWTPPEDRPETEPPAAMLRPEARAKNLEEALDGLRYVAYVHPDDYAALMWVRSNLPPDAIILEAAGSQYTYASRFGTMTGRPSFAGWLTHSWVWRGAAFGNPDQPNNERQRRSDITANIYSEDDPQATLAMLRAEVIEYVVVGDLEREQYPAINENKFAAIGDVVFSHGNTVIYKVREPE